MSRCELKLCDCNGTLPLDGAAIGKALGGRAQAVHHALCRQQVGEVKNALAGGGDVLIACTQEAPLFAELAEEAGFSGSLRFASIREHAGWSGQAAQATPKMAALLAAGMLPDPEPVPGISLRSSGSLLVIGPGEAALAWAEQLADSAEASGSRIGLAVLATDGSGELPAVRRYPVWNGTRASVSGWLGAFDVAWEQANAIDLERCTRCNACIAACPEGAIGAAYQIDAGKCRGHRHCAAACGAGAIDFSRADRARSETFDLVLDLGETPLLRMSQPPQGYAAPGRDPLQQALAVAKLAALVGEFEKPRYFSYNARLCAHARSGKAGCSQCIDTCSTAAIRADGDGVFVEPHLCMGCGGCATVCPSGAMRYAYPGVRDTGARLKTLLATYARAGGRNACVLFHDARGGGRSDLLQAGRLAAARRGPGLPARVLPFEVNSISATGIDLLLGAIAYGAAQCVLLVGADEAPEYRAALQRQTGYAEAILHGLGYAGRHFHVRDAGDAAALAGFLHGEAPEELGGAAAPALAASFNLSDAKRETLDFAIDHLARQAPTPRERISLAAGAPFGEVRVDQARCTLCMSCVGACPANALSDSPDAPRLSFVEGNCVQCGLCAATCPEKAISLVPGLALGIAAKERRTLNEAEPFHCVSCGKPFATRQMIEGMSARLSGNSHFADGVALRRLQMCADCRVAALMDSSNEATIHDFAQ